MYLIIDNYDSFTYNIVQYLSELTTDSIKVVRNDRISIQEIEKMRPSGIIISPGPGRPEDAGISMDVVRTFAGSIPILGICLGHQVIGEAFGGKIIQARHIMHGKTDSMTHDGRGLFRSVIQPAKIVRYHSLSIEEESFPEVLEITSRASDGEIMGIRHREYVVEGVQFHPESIAGDDGKKMLKNFLCYKRESFNMKYYLTKIMQGTDLTKREASEVMDELTDGDLDDPQIAAFLTALNMKGFTADEIAGCVEVLRDKRVPLDYPDPLLDTCGTGGDGLGTFNISSYTALICAACGVKVAKHGNRAVSSMSGSADFYRALGITIDLSPEEARVLLDRTSFTFLFAPYYHGAMRYAAPVRKSLGMKTIMNVLGPLANPAASVYQIIGVYDHSLLKKVARAAKTLGVRRVMTVHGADGEDEISVTGPTDIFFIDEEGRESFFSMTPEQFGFRMYDVSELKGGTADENAEIAHKIGSSSLDFLSGEDDTASEADGFPYEAVLVSVLLNSGAALFTAGTVSSIEDGISRAAAAIEDGRVRQKLDEIIAVSASCSDAVST